MSWPKFILRAYVRQISKKVGAQLSKTIPLATAKRSPRLALLTSCGVYQAGDQPFDAGNRRGDPTTRVFSLKTPKDKIRVAHPHYDHAGVQEDLDICLPKRACETLVKQGTIQELYPIAYTFMGYMWDVDIFMNRYAHEVANALEAAHVDAALLTPC